MGGKHGAPEKRFNSKYTVNSEGCHIWTDGLNSSGYGAFWNGTKLVGAHVYSFTRYYGKPKFNVLHTCDVRACVNPEHLFDGTDKVNYLDMTNKGRNPHIKLSDSQVSEIRQKYKSFVYTERMLAKEYNVNKGHIHRIVTNKQRIL